MSGKSKAICETNISVTTDGSGNASQDSDAPIYGQIMAIGFTKDTVNGGTTAVVTTKNAPIQSLDSYNVNTGNAMRYVRAAVQGSSAGDNKWCPFIVADTINVVATSGAASKHFLVTIYYIPL